MEVSVKGRAGPTDVEGIIEEGFDARLPDGTRVPRSLVRLKSGKAIIPVSNFSSEPPLLAAGRVIGSFETNAKVVCNIAEQAFPSLTGKDEDRAAPVTPAALPAPGPEFVAEVDRLVKEAKSDITAEQQEKLRDLLLKNHEVFCKALRRPGLSKAPPSSRATPQFGGNLIACRTSKRRQSEATCSPTKSYDPLTAGGPPR